MKLRSDNIDINTGEWLVDAIKREKRSQGHTGDVFLPSNIILDKTLPGLGATHMEIHAKRNSIIIEPNVPVILGKTKGKPELLAVYEKCSVKQIEEYMQNKSVVNNKLITTPEGFEKILKASKNLNIDIYKDYFCLFDECEKITQDHDYRENISYPMRFFFYFKDKALVSATPLELSDPQFKTNNFSILKVNPTYPYIKDIDLIVTNDFDGSVIDYLKSKENSDCICVFFNSIDGINKIMHSLNIDSESKVFCSQKSVGKLEKKDFTNVYEDLDFPLAKYNFFSSRFYSAVDIKLGNIKPDVLLLTQHNTKSHTEIDPSTEAIQIYGRFRNGYNSLTHITTVKQQDYMIPDVIKLTIKEYEKDYRSIATRETTYAFDKNITGAQRKSQNALPYAKYLYPDDSVNYFAIDNLYYDERIKYYYQDISSIKKAYQDTKHFNVTIADDTNKEPQSILKMRNLNAKEQRIAIIESLEEIGKKYVANSTYNKDAQIKLLRRVNSDLVTYYLDLGEAEIKACDYNMSKIERKHKKLKTEEHRLSKAIAKEVYKTFNARENSNISKKDIQIDLQKIYDNNSIDYKVRQNTIEDYYSGFTHSNSTKTYNLQIRNSDLV